MVTLRVVDPDPEPGRAPVYSVRDCRSTRGLDAIVKTAFVSTYPPQRCGIATFTADLAAAVGHPEIVALQPPEKPGFYPAEVGRRIARDVPADYPSAARGWTRAPSTSSRSSTSTASGVATMARTCSTSSTALQTPVVATLHTVLQKPTAAAAAHPQRARPAPRRRSSCPAAAASLLTRSYGTTRRASRSCPHGVPHLPLVASDTAKPQLGLKGRTVILSFGLLGPGKGYESRSTPCPRSSRRPDGVLRHRRARPIRTSSGATARRTAPGSLVARVARSASATTSASSAATSSRRSWPCG